MQSLTDTPDRSREVRIVSRFVRVYCANKHTPSNELCSNCSELLEYALIRLKRCPYSPKPPCKLCPTHCYNPQMRQRIKEVMKYSGKYYVKRGRLDWLVKYFLATRQLNKDDLKRISSQAKRSSELLAQYDTEYDADHGFESPS